jgi:hypothetical protein
MEEHDEVGNGGRTTLSTLSLWEYDKEEHEKFVQQNVKAGMEDIDRMLVGSR